jgi:hypothetical protein
MCRPERLHVPGGSYFVVDEFRSREVLVPAPDRNHTDAEVRKVAAHRAQYEAQLAYALMRWCARVHTHCWLPECALLEIQIAWAPLEHVMHSLRGPFSRYFRKAAGSPEAVYASRYKAWLLDPGCALDLRRDICWRPVRAGLCRHPTEYPHTTIHYAAAASIPPFLARSHLLAWFQQRQHHPRAQLLGFLSAAPSPGFPALLSGSPHDRRIVGHPDFVRKIHREEPRSPPTVPPESVIAWARHLVERSDTTAATSFVNPVPTLMPALTAWLASSSGITSVSTAATWFPRGDRSRLERAIDHYQQVRPDLFNERTLRQFVHQIPARSGTLQ